MFKIITLGESGVGKTAFQEYESGVKVDLREVKRLGYNPFIAMLGNPSSGISTITNNSVPSPQASFTTVPVPSYDKLPITTAKKDNNSSTDNVTINKLVTLQAADGTWTINEELAKIIRCTHNLIQTPPKNFNGTSDMWATSLALAYLIKLKADKDDRYQLIIRKGRDTIQKSNVLLEDPIKIATNFLNKHQTA